MPRCLPARLRSAGQKKCSPGSSPGAVIVPRKLRGRADRTPWQCHETQLTVGSCTEDRHAEGTRLRWRSRTDQQRSLHAGSLAASPRSASRTNTFPSRRSCGRHSFAWAAAVPSVSDIAKPARPALAWLPFSPAQCRPSAQRIVSHRHTLLCGTPREQQAASG